MDARALLSRSLIALLSLMVVVGGSGCGFVLREEAIPEQLPTTTLAPTPFPDVTGAIGEPEVGTQGLFDEEGEGEGGVPGSTQPPVVVEDKLLVEAELDKLVSGDAPPLCRTGAAASYFFADAVAAGLDLETGEAYSSPDVPRIRAGMERVADELEVVIPQLLDAGAELGSTARLDAALDDLRATAQSPGADLPLVLEFRRWWNRHGESLRGVLSGLGVLCAGEPFVEYLGGWG